MDDKFVRNRISELRTKKGVSEYKMSLDLGDSKSYIQSISSGKALPSFCKLTKLAKALSPEDLSALINMAERLADK